MELALRIAKVFAWWYRIDQIIQRSRRRRMDTNRILRRSL